MITDRWGMHVAYFKRHLTCRMLIIKMKTVTLTRSPHLAWPLTLCLSWIYFGIPMYNYTKKKNQISRSHIEYTTSLSQVCYHWYMLLMYFPVPWSHTQYNFSDIGKRSFRFIRVNCLCLCKWWFCHSFSFPSKRIKREDKENITVEHWRTWTYWVT